MRIALRIFLGVIALVILFAAFIQIAPLPTYDVPLPEVSLKTDSATIARGEYLVWGPAHCAGCHTSWDKDSVAIRNGERVALQGGNSFDFPMGTIYIPNLTPDVETGIGSLSDGEIARAMRYGINHESRAMIPAMPFTHMSEEDVAAIIAYLRSREPVHHEVPASNFTFMGKALWQFMIKPFEQSEPIPERVEPALSIEYGSYLANDVANCKGCHTTFDMSAMAYNGPPMAGGMEMTESIHQFKTPNLTPDPTTGHIYSWSEDQFVARFKAGKVFQDSPMAWESFALMTELEVRAIYRYLQSLDPVENNTSPVVVRKDMLAEQ